jgi:protein gp37
MGDKTAIEWTRSDDGTPGATWNPVRGTTGTWCCVKVSPGCTHCYAARLNQRRGGPDYRVGADAPRLDAMALVQPLRWTRPRRIFVCSMTDLFWDQVPDEWIDQVFAIMAICDGKRLRENSGRRRLFNAAHTFQVLTKRAERIRRYLTDPETPYRIAAWVAKRYVGFRPAKGSCDWHPWSPWPLPQVWLGTSVESQPHMTRVDELLGAPAAVRWVSAEPLLGPLDFRRRLTPEQELDADYRPTHTRWTALDWVVAGGESGGPAERALVMKSCVRGDCTPPCPCAGTGYAPKPEALAWVRAIRDQCEAAGVPFFFKQWGGPTAKSGGRVLDGRTWDEYPSAAEASR